MTERAPKRPRAISTEDESSEAEEDWQRERHTASSASSRPRRGQPAPAPPDQSRLRLTVKQPSSRLRNVTNASDAVPRGARQALGRASKNKRPIVDESSDDEEDDDEGIDEEDEDGEDEEGGEEDEEEEENEEGGEEDEEMEDENDEDRDEDDEEEEEEEEDDEDEEMEDATPVAPPRIKISAPGGNRKLTPTRTLKLKGNIKSVEEKELESINAGQSDDEELSELEDSQMEDEMGQHDDEMDDEEGGDVIAADDVGEDELDSSEENSDEDGSRSGTPDLSKLTRRQRAHFEEMEGGLMSLSNEAQKKKFFTPEQLSMRRAEMARRRKDLSDRRNEEEKADTLNRLLHKQAPKRRSKAQMLADAERDEFGTPAAEEERASKLYARTVINDKGTVIAVPHEWLGAPAGRLFEDAKKSEGGPQTLKPGRLVEVIE